MKLFLSLAALLLGAATAAAEPPRFVEETASGLDGTYAGDWEYMVGGGAAVFDCNGDGFEDVLLAGGEAPARFYANRSTRGGSLRFERQQSGLEFDAVTGAYPLDIDGDGIMDVALLRIGENMLMKGEGGCRFARANEAWGFDGGDAWSTAFAAVWEDGSGWPTIAIGNYIDREEEFEPWGSCTANWLHRPAAHGKGFAPPLALEPSHCPLSMLFTDWSNSGTAEYYEGGQEQMWRVRPGEAPVLYGEEDGWRYLRIWGMGLAGHDLDGDGFQEYFLTSMADNKLQTLADPPKDGSPPRPDYKDIAWSKGVTAHRPFMGDDLKPSTAWHTDFQDVNNDGLVDLFIAKGNVAEMPDFALEDPNNLLVQEADGRFTEMAGKAGVASTRVSRGGALADFNLDGRLDLLVVNRWTPAQLWRNVTENAGNWLMLRLSQEGPNVNAIGAFLEVKTEAGVQRREITSGGGHVSGRSGWIHVGIGNSRTAELRVRWPGGGWSAPQPLAAGSFAILDRAEGAPQPWNPAR